MEKPLQTENLEIKLTKKVKDLYTENFKLCEEEFDYLNKWK